jgi:hypothetical protein
MEYPVKFGGLPVSILCILIFGYGCWVAAGHSISAIKTGVFVATTHKSNRNDNPSLFWIQVLICWFISVFCFAYGSFIAFATILVAMRK